MTSMTVARGDYTYVTKCEDMELEDVTSPQGSCPPNIYNHIRSFSIDSQKRKSIPSVVTARVAVKMQGNYPDYN